MKITTRFKACGCGCKGADSWHKPTINRVVRGITAASTETMLGLRIVARGTAKMPWGVEPVVALAYKSESRGLWHLEEMRCGLTWAAV